MQATCCNHQCLPNCFCNWLKIIEYVYLVNYKKKKYSLHPMSFRITLLLSNKVQFGEPGHKKIWLKSAGLVWLTPKYKCFIFFLFSRVPDISFGLTNWSKTGNDSTNGILNDYSNGSQMGLGETQIEQKIQKENKHLLLLSVIVVTINSSLHICSLKSKKNYPENNKWTVDLSVPHSHPLIKLMFKRSQEVDLSLELLLLSPPSSHYMINLTTKFTNSINLTLDIVLFYIYRVPWESIQNMASLHTLNLDHNLIDHIAEGVFGELYKLARLDMTSNRLRTLPPDPLFAR